MAVRTHDSKWRLLVAGAPLLGVAFVVFAALQGEPEVARSRNVMEILAGVAALGAVLAWWTALQLRAAPAVAVALAQPGQASLSGRAQALPGAPPLLSPDSAACLWFKHSEQTVRHYDASDSVRPFLLVDATGQCMVLPAGADITGGGSAGGSRERLLREGDDIHVVGLFTPASMQSLDHQVLAYRLVEQVEAPRMVLRSNDAAVFHQTLAVGTPPMPAPAQPQAPMALPVLSDPGGAKPFIISIGSRDGQAGLYGFFAAADALVLCAAAGNYLWFAH